MGLGGVVSGGCHTLMFPSASEESRQYYLLTLLILCSGFSLPIKFLFIVWPSDGIQVPVLLSPEVTLARFYF